MVQDIRYIPYSCRDNVELEVGYWSLFTYKTYSYYIYPFTELKYILVSFDNSIFFCKIHLAEVKNKNRLTLRISSVKEIEMSRKFLSCEYNIYLPEVLEKVKWLKLHSKFRSGSFLNLGDQEYFI